MSLSISLTLWNTVATIPYVTIKPAIQIQVLNTRDLHGVPQSAFVKSWKSQSKVNS